MARKSYTQEFRQQAVELYEATPGATFKTIAADLGISRGALSTWVGQFGSGATTALGVVTVPGKPETQAARLARLEAENAALRVETRKLATERDILRSAAKYFANETTW